ncbi:MAG: HAD family hydrolase [Dehalococcoidia bacterium]
MPVRAILFDLGDTLFQLGPMPDDLAARVRRALPAPFDSLAKEIVDEVVARNAAAHRDGAHWEVPVAAIASARFAAQGRGHEPAAAMAVAALGFADTGRWRGAQDTAARVAAFRARGLAIAYVSNTTTPARLMRQRLHELGLVGLADAAVFSSEYGERKPSPAIYGEALDRLGVPAHEAVFVGDRVREDVLAPQALGMRGVLTHEFRQEPFEPARPDAVLRTLPDLHRALSGWM